MPKRKRQSKKKLAGKGRITDATRWLKQLRNFPENLVEAYSKRYKVSEIDAREELVGIGYYEAVLIQEYEKIGIEWEYRVEPLSGDMIVVPKGIEEHELYEHYRTF
ncbi:hypothetical protein G8764_22055 [Pseudomaricurvus alcaniphilus]|uniref:hypothetical protein n=1 Tax=Pseudomaricurvus alcaniphilus TaxID=1166482 RepID=UPI00140D013A|nr:hypothetical protein [Pseudomaricurvus alcaniphilus]NHN39990.1 hypothetical protein [Pseudomaricurvus alcaniphilus]